MLSDDQKRFLSMWNAIGAAYTLATQKGDVEGFLAISETLMTPDNRSASADPLAALDQRIAGVLGDDIPDVRGWPEEKAVYFSCVRAIRAAAKKATTAQAQTAISELGTTSTLEELSARVQRIKKQDLFSGQDGH